MPMTMYEIAFPVTINIGAWAVVYVRQIGQIANSGLGAPGKDFSWPLQTKIFPIPLERPYLAGIAFFLYPTVNSLETYQGKVEAGGLQTQAPRDLFGRPAFPEFFLDVGHQLGCTPGSLFVLRVPPDSLALRHIRLIFPVFPAVAFQLPADAGRRVAQDPRYSPNGKIPGNEAG